MSSHVLIIEDERDLVTTLEYSLKSEGFTTQAIFSGDDALPVALQSPRPNIIILDIMLPGIYGIEVCRRLKSHDKTRDIPIIILSARGDDIDKVEGFSVGADDYVVKPFQMRELILRIKAILRRTGTKEKSTQESGCQRFGSLMVDPIGIRVTLDNREIPLTRTEFKLLTNLINHQGAVKSRDELLSEIWGEQSDVKNRTIDVHIRSLRDKLKEAGNTIETIRGVGYRFSAPAGT